jgi:hypothetical protein
MNESKNVFVSSRGLLKSCDYYSTTPISSIKIMYNYPDFNNFKKNLKNTKNIPSIYVCGIAIPHFIYTLLPSIDFKFILVSGDCDEEIPYDIMNKDLFEKFINDTRLVHWFSQNLICKHQKMSIIPIGMDYHTMATKNIFWGPKTDCLTQELLLKKLKEKSLPFYERDIKCYSNFHFTLNTRYGNDRIDAIKNIPKEIIYYEETKVKRLVSWNNQLKYAFVVSPHGQGYDCHRLWEALLLGCIVIVKKSDIDDLYQDLPVLIVNKWSEVNYKLLQDTIDEFKYKKFNYKKLELKYWVNKINNMKE